MAGMMNLPVLGIVENMSYFVCDNCNKEHYIFGESMVDEVASRHAIPITQKLPIDSKLREACDNGEIENYENAYMTDFAKALNNILDK